MEVIKKKSWVSIIIKAVLAVSVLIVLLFALLHTGFVQDRITKYILSTVIAKSEGKLQVQGAAFDIYKGVELSGLLLTGSEADTLLVVDKLRLNPRSTLLSFLSGNLRINDLSISGVDFVVRKKMDDTQSNWGRMLSSLGAGNQNQNRTKKTAFDFSQMELSDVTVSYIDDPGGISMEAYFDRWEVVMDHMVFGDSASIQVRRWILNKPVVNFHRTMRGIRVEQEMDKKEAEGTIFPRISIADFNVLDGAFYLMDESDEAIQYREFSELDLGIHDLLFEDPDTWSLAIEDLSGKTEEAQIRHFSIANLKRKGGEIQISRSLLRTDQSLIRFNGSISGMAGFIGMDRASVKLELIPSFVRISDLFGLFPDLRREFGNEAIAFYPVQLKGNYTWKDGRLDGRKIDLWINKSHHFVGDAVLSEIRGEKPLFLDLTVTDLSSDIAALSALYSKIPVSEELRRMGKIQFNGNFKGMFSDFNASGNLKSQLGNASMNVTVKKLSPIGDSIAYAGLLELDSFDLGKLLMNPEFGHVSAKLNIADGRGIDLINSEASLIATIDKFVFRDFVYSDAVYEGRLNRKVIDGAFRISDESLDFRFSGIVDLSREEPLFDFRLDAQRIDFCKLNLVEFPCQLSFNSEVNFQGKTMKNAEGQSRSGEIIFRHDSLELRIANLLIDSEKSGDHMKFRMRSDFIDMDIEGDFHLLKMYQIFLRQLIKNHPGHNNVVNLKDDFGDLPDQNFVFDVKVKDANALFDFIDLDLEMEDVAAISGYFDKEAAQFVVDLEAPLLAYKDFVGDSIKMKISSANRNGDFFLEIRSLSRNQSRLSNISIHTDIVRNRFDWSASYVYNDGNLISLVAQSLVEDKGYYTRIIDHHLVLDNEEWTILPNRGIGIYKDEIDIENFEITDGTRYIAVKDIDRKGLEVSMNDFNFEVINPLINYDKLYFTGSADSKMRIENIFEERAVQGFLEVPDFAINGDDYGTLLLRANQAGKDVIDVDLRIVKEAQELYTRGYINTSDEYVNVDITLKDYPMNFFEYIITDGISETEGTTDIEAKIYGNFNDLKLSGLAEVREAGVRIDYLGTYYRMENQTIKIDEKFVDLNGVELIDARENRAVMTGGLRHDFLGDFRTDLTITSPEFIALSTTDLDNPLYYGIGNGDLTVRFDGPFDAVDMRVTATTGPFTQLFIPITSTQYGYDESFIKFDYRKEQADSLNVDDLLKRFQQSGVDFEMNLTFTPDAEVSVIYDESTSNVLEGRGRGNLSIKVKRDGEFSVYGNYDIEEGEYRYTAYGFIAKPFIINRGGRVSWTGDPINASLEVTAGYAGLRAPLNVFLQEYIESSTLQAREFSQRREVDLTLLLTGTLFNPEINFDIGFPNLTGELKTLADSKVRALESTENGINNQVVGLLVFRNFLPDNNPFASLDGSTLGQSGNNTITEFLTSQLSLLFTEYLSARLKDNGLIEGIDFEIAVAQNTSVLDGTGQDLFEGFVDFVPDEVQLNLRNRFKNDNLVLNIGGNYVRQSEFETVQDYLTGDFALDWFISEDKRLKLRFYGNYDYDEAFAERKQIYGFGISYRREFGAISKLMDALENVVEEVNRLNGNSTSSNR